MRPKIARLRSWAGLGLLWIMPRLRRVWPYRVRTLTKVPHLPDWGMSCIFILVTGAAGCPGLFACVRRPPEVHVALPPTHGRSRSEERRVGKEGRISGSAY